MAGFVNQNEVTSIDYWYVGKNSTSSMGKIYLKTQKRFCNYLIEKNRLLVIEGDEPIEGACCVKTNITNFRHPVPEAVVQMYDEKVFFDHHPCTRTKGKSTIEIKRKSKKAFSLPYGTSYTEVAPRLSTSEYVKLSDSLVEYAENEMRNTLSGYSTPLYVMTVVQNDDKSYILVEPIYNGNDCVYPNYSEMEKYVGTYCSFFPKGVMRILTKPELLKIPKSFLYFNDLTQKNAKVSIYSNGESFVIVPKERNCIIDNGPIRVSEFSGTRAAVCSCVNDTKNVERAGSLVEKIYSLMQELLEKNAVLEAENKKLKEQLHL